MARVAAVACFAAAVIGTIAWALHEDRPGVIGSNGIRPVSFVVTVPPHRKACEAPGLATGPVDRVLVTVTADGKAPQPLQLQIPDGRRGAILRTYADGVISLPLPAGSHAIGGPACIRNLGRLPVRIAGEPAVPGQGAVIRGRPSNAYIAFVLVDDTPPSWWSQASSVLARVGLGRGGAGGRSVGVVVVALLVACLLATLGTVWRWVS